MCDAGLLHGRSSARTTTAQNEYAETITSRRETGTVAASSAATSWKLVPPRPMACLFWAPTQQPMHHDVELIGRWLPGELPWFDRAKARCGQSPPRLCLLDYGVTNSVRSHLHTDLHGKPMRQRTRTAALAALLPQ